MCKNGSVEDEYHALVECPAYNKERNALYQQVLRKTQGRLDLSIMVDNKDWMLLVLLGPGIFDNKTANTRTKAVGNYVHKCALKRQTLLCSPNYWGLLELIDCLGLVLE